jgi:tetratricopeptide (TPR) repeat protein
MEVADRLVGRDLLLATLERTLDAGRHGDASIVLLTGEAGIGKTAVLSALSARAAERSMATAWGRCWAGAAAPAFWPWVQVVRTLGEQPGVDLGAAQLMLPGANSTDGVPVGGAAARFDLFDGVSRLLALAAADHGLLVALDDLQWADDASLSLLEFVGLHLGPAPIVIVGTYRDDEARPELVRLGRAASVIPLAGLDHDDAHALASIIGGAMLTPAAAADVARRSGGNPLFLRELARLVASRPFGAGAAEDTTRLGGVREVVARRLDRLSGPCREMLEVAAVLGQQIRPDILMRVMGSGEDLADLLGDAVRARVLVPPTDDLADHRFAHDLFREVMVAEMAPSTRAQIHLAVARALEEMRDRGAPIPMASLAAHFAAAATAGLRAAASDAIRCSRSAAVEATRQMAFEDAVEHLRRALHLLARAESSPPGAHVALLLELGIALDRAGDTRAARAAFVDAAEVARLQNDAEALAEAALGVHRLGGMSGMPRTETVRLLEEAALGLAGDTSALRARVSAGLARELHHTWEPANLDRSRQVAEEAVSHAREAGDAWTLAFCLLAQHDAEWTPGSASRRLPIVAEMLDLAPPDDEELLAQAQLLKATALLELGHESAPAELERYCRVAEGLGHARGRWGAVSRRATVALLTGRFETASSLGAAALRLGQQIGEPDALGVSDTLRWGVARFQGGLEALEPADHWVPSASWPPHRAVALAARGDTTAARAALDGFSVRHDHEHGARRHDGWTAAVMADAVIVAGSSEQQASVYELLRPLAGTHFVFGACMGYGGAVDHHLGALALALDRPADARTHLERALSMHETLGATAWVTLDRSLLATLEVPPARSPRVPAMPAVPAPAENALRREGDTWVVTFRGRTSRLRHVKGLLDLAALLREPGREVLALDLMGGFDVGSAPGPVLDERARREYRARVGELQSEIEEAQQANDWARAERAEAELDAFVEQLASAFGLGGRQRAAGSAAERARAAVTHRVRAAIRRIGEGDPEAGRHLRNAVKTGTWCAYQPDIDVSWTVDV